MEKYSKLTSTACKRPSDGGTGFKGKQMKLLETKQVSQKTVDQAILRFIVQAMTQSYSLALVTSRHICQNMMKLNKEFMKFD
ncbi:unnamed protein product [Boreogadus saida]